MPLFLYNILLILLSPYILLSSKRRSYNPSSAPFPNANDIFLSRLTLGKLFNKSSQKVADPTTSGVIWIHAASAGETKSTDILIQKIIQTNPQQNILITNVSVNGIEHSVRLQKRYPQLQHTMLPLDFPWIINRFLKYYRPQTLILIEKELWPNLINKCHKNNIPIHLVSAQLLDRTKKGWQKPIFRRLIKQLLQKITTIGAQHPNDRKNLLILGANPQTLSISGNIKFNARIPHNLSQQSQQLKHFVQQQIPNLNQRTFIWIAGSIHQGEQITLLDAHRELLQEQPDSLLIIAPRQPKEFQPLYQECQQYCQQHQIPLTLHQLIKPTDNLTSKIGQFTQSSNPNRNSNSGQIPGVYFLNVTGELQNCYAFAQVVFIGGSLVDLGAHNPIEAALLGIPVLSGKSYFEQIATYTPLIEHQLIDIVDNAQQLKKRLVYLKNHPEVRQTLAKQLQDICHQNQPNLTKLLHAITSLCRPTQ